MSESEATTRGVKVQVESNYLADRSNPAMGQWLFTYRVRISNEGLEPVQLVSRHWVITDANGEVREVQGPGVVGAQPRLDPGEVFEYRSFCPLETPVGTMHGTYQMVAESGDRFDAEVAPFSLSEPMSFH
ncbi:MAG: Co2+/Mg2+ efflux protein ApaG [Rickettsiales bacterium]|nr:Co2+/Mg2+ efflux protein ApaG [Rickettsiales bacterium]|tara:strand:- start:235 stop:624 length:390 start_codon:yes stop_codon:yes gene_type:complete